MSEPIIVQYVHKFGGGPLTAGEAIFLTKTFEKIEREMPERNLLMSQLEEGDTCDE